MDPISIILGAIYLLTAAAYVISVVLLTLAVIGELFENWQEENYVDEDDVGFITKNINSGDCTHIQGVFNQHTGKVRDAWKIKANSVNSEVRGMLNRRKVVIFD